MNKLLIIALAVGAVLAFSLAASAQYVPPEQVAPGVVEPVPVPAPLDEGAAIITGPVRIIPVDPAVANLTRNTLAESGQLAQIQAEVASDPMLSAELAAANIPFSDVFEVATDVDGVTTIYVIG